MILFAGGAEIMEENIFNIFAHGPFATNIHLDAAQLENLKLVFSQKPLGVKEYYVLEYIRYHDGKTTVEELFNELKQRIKIIIHSDVLSTVHKLEMSGFVKKEKSPDTQFKIIRASHFVKGGINTKVLRRSSEEKDLGNFSKGRYSITEKGIEKLESSYDKDYYLRYFGVDIDEFTDKSLEDLWRNIYGERVEYLPITRQVTDEQQKENENSFFGDEDRPFILAKFRLPSFPASNGLISPNNLEIRLRFDDNTITFYGSGVGLFSSRITVQYKGSIHDIIKVRNELDASVKKAIQNVFKEYGSEYRRQDAMNKIKQEGRFRLIDGFNLEQSRTSKLAWIHLIYWFYEKEYQKCDSRGLATVSEDVRDDFIDLLEQVPENMSVSRDRFIFYGWGRSLILTRDPEESTLKWIQNQIKLVETGQYSCFGHILIDHLLRRRLSRLVLDASGSALRSSILKEKIENFDKMRSAIVTYIEEFRSGINTILLSGETSLVKTLENQWRLEKLRESIRVKTESLGNERVSLEQSLLNEKQDRTNKIVLAFTIMGIASVTSAIVTLSPLSDWIEKENHFLSYFSQVFFFIITTIIVISLTVVLVTKWYEITRWMRSNQELRRYRKYMKQIIHSKESTSSHTSSLLREINDAYNKNKITRSQNKKLVSEILDRKSGARIL
jgi:DNA-binding MarR family transcriptional regulator